MNQRILSSTCNQLTAASHTIYNGSIDCAVRVSWKLLIENREVHISWQHQHHYFSQTVRNEGFAALYKGFIPTWVRMVSWENFEIKTKIDWYFHTELFHIFFVFIQIAGSLEHYFLYHIRTIEKVLLKYSSPCFIREWQTLISRQHTHTHSRKTPPNYYCFFNDYDFTNSYFFFLCFLMRYLKWTKKKIIDNRIYHS